MGIKRIKIENFKSFKSLDVELGNFNILVGPNAAGKSNFIHIFEFLRDIVNHGLENAVAMHGYVEYFRNISAPDSNGFSIEVIYDYGNREIIIPQNERTLYSWSPYEISYRFEIDSFNEKSGFRVSEEELFVKFKLLTGRLEDTLEGSYRIIEKGSEYKTNVNLPNGIKIEYLPSMNYLLYLVKNGVNENAASETVGINLKKSLFLESPSFRIPVDTAVFFHDLSVYNFDPKLSKKAIPITGKNELEEDGGNLAIVLKHILDDENKRSLLSNIIKDVLSFVDHVDIKKFSDRSMVFRIKEEYSGKRFLPASLLSDGTINITALILALFFGKKSVNIFEEPERNIHPHLISKILAMMKEQSAHKQIIVTTHNPEILRHADPADILFIARDEEGFSQITRPAENEQVKTFLENEMGMDELYVQNLLTL